MPHSFLGVTRDCAVGHPNYVLGVVSATPCHYGCRTYSVIAPPADAGRLCRDGDWLNDNNSLSRDCPSNPASVPLALHAPPAAAAAAAACPVAALAAAAIHADGEWSPAILRALPPPFALEDFQSAIQNARTPNATETRLDESRTSTTARVLDHFTNKVFEREHWTPPREVFDSLPKRLASAATRRIATAVQLILALSASIAANQPLRNALAGVEVDLSERLPGVEVIIEPAAPPPGQPPPPPPGRHPTALNLVQTITTLLLDADGILIESAHLPNAIRAAEHSGIQILQGNVNAIKDVKMSPALQHLYSSTLDSDESADLTIFCRPLTATLVFNARARLSLFYRTPTMWPPRKRLLRLHWRHYWHLYIVYCDDAVKTQAVLQAALNLFRRDDAQLALMRAASAADKALSPGLRPGGDQSRLTSGADLDGVSPSRNKRRQASNAMKEAEKKRRVAADSASPAAAAAAARAASASSATSTPLVPYVPPPSNASSASGAATSLPLCKIDSCPSCKALKGSPHATTCAWVAGIRARGGTF